MNHGGRGVLGGRGEEETGLAAGDVTGRVIGLAIKVHKTVGPDRDFWNRFMWTVCVSKWRVTVSRFRDRLNCL